jgi:hypothetical protein
MVCADHFFTPGPVDEIDYAVMSLTVHVELTTEAPWVNGNAEASHTHTFQVQ